MCLVSTANARLALSSTNNNNLCVIPQVMETVAWTLCYESSVMLKSRHLFKHYRRQKASRSKRWQMPPSLARRCTWVLVFIRKSSPKLLNGFILFEGKGIKLHFVSFMLQLVFVCLVWDSAPSLGRWWHKPGPSPSVLLDAVGLGSEGLWEQIARQCGELVRITASSPFICQALAQPLSHIPLFWRALAVCPPIGHCVRGRARTKAAGWGALAPTAKA